MVLSFEEVTFVKKKLEGAFARRGGAGDTGRAIASVRPVQPIADVIVNYAIIDEGRLPVFESPAERVWSKPKSRIVGDGLEVICLTSQEVISGQ
jgi:hypothetical protein